MESLTSRQKKVARLIQKDIAVTTFPFEETGNLCGLTGAEVLDTINKLLKKGFIRKF
jgi:DNA-binding Lrp family transcriptional regulator